MSTYNINSLSELQLDALREIGNIGMGSAATALAAMLNNKVDMKIPKLYLLTEEETKKLACELDKDCLSIILRLTQGMDGCIVHFLRKSFAEKVIGFFFDAGEIDLMNMDEMSMSVISEVGNITSASYVNAVAAMTGMTIDISPPTRCLDFSAETKFSGDIGERRLMFIDTDFFIDNEEIKSSLFFMPDGDGISAILEHLGI